VRDIQIRKFSKIHSVLNKYMTKRDKKDIMKELNKFENALREENPVAAPPMPEEIWESNTEKFDSEFEKIMLRALNAEPYRVMQSNQDLEKILEDKK
jgi:hypothetical protein